MTNRVSVTLLGFLAAGCWILAGCGDDTTKPPDPSRPVCDAPVTVTVSMDSLPVFSWTPDCSLGRLIVEQGFDEYWGTETCGDNTYASPLRYGINPPNTCPEEPARDLAPGLTYTVSVYRFVTVNPESLQLLGTQNFDY